MSKIFIPNGEGFKELQEGAGKSMNDIGEILGYNPDQLHTYFGDFKDPEITNVIVEVFTKDIVYIISKNNSITKRNVDYFFRNFRLEEEFGSFTAQGILDDGIENKTLRVEFLARALNIRNAAPDGVFNVPFLGLDLAFSNGYLTDFFSADGLNEASRHWKEINPNFINSYKKEAEFYWGNSVSKVFNEINSQADAYANTPDAMLNEFVPLHKSRFGNVNFAMLMVCHYNRKITLDEYKEINHGRFEVLATHSTGNKFQVGNFTYEFSEDGILSDVQNAPRR